MQHPVASSDPAPPRSCPPIPQLNIHYIIYSQKSNDSGIIMGWLDFGICMRHPLQLLNWANADLTNTDSERAIGYIIKIRKFANSYVDEIVREIKSRSSGHNAE